VGLLLAAAVLLRVELRGFVRMMFGMGLMAMRYERVMGGLFVIARLVKPGRFPVMGGGVLTMFCCSLVLFGALVLSHGIAPCVNASRRNSKNRTVLLTFWIMCS
jgi:hypothetical protein